MTKKGSKKISRNNDKTNNKMVINTYLPIIILNVNGLNTPIKRHRVSEWILKKKSICYPQEIHFRSKDPCRLKVRACLSCKHILKDRVAIFTRQTSLFFYCFSPVLVSG